MKKKLNIWLIYQFACTPDLPGSQRSYHYAKAFAQMGHNVTLWTSSFSHWGKVETIQDDASYMVKSEGKLKIISLRTKPAYYRNNYKRILNLLNFAYVFSKISRTVRPLPDVIIASYPSPFAAFAAYRHAIKCNSKFVLEVRDLWPQVWVERKAFSRYHPFIITLYAVEKYLYKRTNILVTALPYVSDYLVDRGLKKQETFWIPNPVNLEDFVHRDDETTSNTECNSICDTMKINRQKGMMNVAYVGGLGPANRVDRILEAARILKDKGETNIFFTIVGEGHSKKDFIEFVSENKLNSVRIWPAVPGNTVPMILRCADVGVLCLHDNPIYKYGVNLHKIYDYMAVGLPIVFAARVRNNLVESAKSGITVSPGNADEIAAALQKFSSMTSEEISLIGNRGHNFIAENYDIDKLSKKYLEIISRNE